MSAARIAGGIVALVFGALLVWLFFASIGPNSMVVPTVAVRTAEDSVPGGRASPAQVLADRTRLMRDRTEAGAGAFPPLSGGDHRFEMRPGVEQGRTLAETWIQNRPDASMIGRGGDLAGVASVPYRNAGMLQQPGGRDWRRAHGVDVRYGGGWVIFGICFALAAFLFARGRIKVAHGWSGETVERFGAVERANHWMTASAFILLGLTGLIIMYGKPLLLPVMGEPGFELLSWWSVWLHMGAAVPFVIGILVMIALWLRENIPNRLDWHWLKRGGGFLRDDGKNPPARKFNAGQKIVFWGVVLGGLALLASGLALMFPFFLFGYDGMQTTQIVHAALALLMIALIFGHIYIGTIGMEGAFDAMWSGRVDRNWAKEHHSLWVQDKKAKDGAPAAGPAGQSAE